MTKEEGSVILENACEGGTLLTLTELYVNSCNPQGAEEKEDKGENRRQKKKTGRFPNVAGFCRYLGIGESEYTRLAAKYPDEFEKLYCVFEDEALNSEISPTLLGAYLKRRLGYDESSKAQKKDVDMGQLKLIFEHDIIADGE